MPTTLTRNHQRPTWYLNQQHIRPTQNASWSPKDREIILRLNAEHPDTIDPIIQAMAQRHGVSPSSKFVSKVRIYNQIRIAKSVSAGKCIRCTEDLQPEDLIANENRGDQKVCVRCLHKDSRYKSTRRKKAVKKGLCGVCLRRKALSGRTQCKPCLNYVQRTRISKGLCCTCGEHPINRSRSKALCNSCLNTNKKNSKKYHRKNK